MKKIEKNEDKHFSVWQQAYTIIDKWENKVLSSNLSYAPTMQSVVDLCDNYWNSIFMHSDRDEDNFKRLFQNLVRQYVRTASKQVDIDQKHIRFRSLGGDYNKIWLFEKDVRQWLRNNDWDEKFNSLSEKLPRYGWFVFKNVKDEVREVKHQNIYWDPTVEIDDSDAVAEEHLYTPQQLRSQNWDSNKVEDVIDDWRDSDKKRDNDYIHIWEVYGEIPTGDGWELRLSVLYPHKDIKDSKTDGILVDQFKKEETPYKQTNWADRPGRGPGMGIIEEVAENQIAVNDTSHFRHKSAFWSSIIGYQTTDDLVERNNLRGMLTGDVVKMQSAPIERIDTQDKNIGHYDNDLNSWTRNAQKSTYSFDPIQGAQMPAGTPASSTRAQMMQGGKYFKKKLENEGNFLKNVLKDWMMDKITRDLKSAHKIILQGRDTDLRKLDSMIVDAKVEAWKEERFEKEHRIPAYHESQIRRQLEKRRIQKNPADYRKIPIPKSYFGNIEYEFEFVITNESIDLGGKSQAYQTALKLASQNPKMFENPRLRKMFYSYLDFIGINPAEIDNVSQYGDESIQESVVRSLAEKSTASPAEGSVNMQQPQTKKSSPVAREQRQPAPAQQVSEQRSL